MAEEINQPLIIGPIHRATEAHNSILQKLRNFYERNSSSDSLWLGVIVAMAILVLLPLFAFGIPYGYDLGQHLRLAQAFREGVLAGDLVPAWGALDNYGFGSIAIRIYPPVFDYIWGLFSIVTGEYYVSIMLTIAFFTIPGSVGIYYWVREYADHRNSGFAAVCYLIVPYHLMQVYQSGLFSEFAAAAVLPFCFLFATRIIQKNRSVDTIGFAVSYAILILTHIPSIIIGSLALSVYCLTLIDWRKPAGVIFRFALSFVLASVASSFYWLRVITEFNWVRVATEVENFSGHYNYRQYLFPMLFSASEDVYWSRLLWVGDIAIVLTFLLVVPSVLVILTTNIEPRLRRLFRSLIVTSVFVLFILSSASSVIWAYAPLLHRIQFSWRFLVAGSVVATVSFILAVPMLWSRFPSSQRVMGYVLLLFAGAILIFNLGEIVLPSAPLSGQQFESKYRGLNESEGCNCFWPTWANAEAFSGRELVMAPGRSVEVLNWDAETRHFVVSEGTEANARVATFWYPYWSAKIDGSPTEVLPDADGAILIPLPAKKSAVTLYFQEPFYLRSTGYLSVFTWLGLVLAFFLFRYRH